MHPQASRISLPVIRLAMALTALAPRSTCLANEYDEYEGAWAGAVIPLPPADTLPNPELVPSVDCSSLSDLSTVPPFSLELVVWPGGACDTRWTNACAVYSYNTGDKPRLRISSFGVETSPGNFLGGDLYATTLGHGPSAAIVAYVRVKDPLSEEIQCGLGLRFTRSDLPGDNFPVGSYPVRFTMTKGSVDPATGLCPAQSRASTTECSVTFGVNEFGRGYVTYDQLCGNDPFGKDDWGAIVVPTSPTSWGSIIPVYWRNPIIPDGLLIDNGKYFFIKDHRWLLDLSTGDLRGSMTLEATDSRDCRQITIAPSNSTACLSQAVVGPGDRHVEGADWSMNVSVTSDDGARISDVRMGTRLVINELDFPFGSIDNGRIELRPDGDQPAYRSRLVRVRSVEDDVTLRLEYRYVIDRIPRDVAGCVVVDQIFDFFPEQTYCEGTGDLTCAQMFSRIRFESYSPSGKQHKVSIAKRIAIAYARTAALLKDAGHYDHPVSGENPLETEVAQKIIARGRSRKYDNLHVTFRDFVDEPDTDIVGGALSLGCHAGHPGCPDCFHTHWRWIDFPDHCDNPLDNDGDPIIPRGSKQNMMVAVTRIDSQSEGAVGDLGRAYPTLSPAAALKALARTDKPLLPQFPLVAWFAAQATAVEDEFFSFPTFIAPARDVSDEFEVQVDFEGMVDGRWVADVHLVRFRQAPHVPIAMALDHLTSGVDVVQAIVNGVEQPVRQSTYQMSRRSPYFEIFDPCGAQVIDGQGTHCEGARIRVVFNALDRPSYTRRFLAVPNSLD